LGVLFPRGQEERINQWRQTRETFPIFGAEPLRQA
jgi:hypothetical protein